MNEHVALLRKSKLSWVYPIYVPTVNRAGKAPFLEMMKKAPARAQARVHIVTVKDQVEAYRAEYPWAKIVLTRIGVGLARMKCLKDADRRGYQRIAVLDDDIVHVSLLERLEGPFDKAHTRRHSSKVSGIEEPLLLLRSLAVACRMSDVIFDNRESASYGGPRNALFSGDVDTRIGVTFNKGSFPACVMLFDVERFDMRDMPTDYRYHGEDLAMFLDALTKHQDVFTLPGVAYDQHSSIESTIPLDPLSPVGRPHLQTTGTHYPDIHPYLRVSVKNKLGGTMRIGMNWKRWYADTQTVPEEVALTTIIKEIK